MGVGRISIATNDWAAPGLPPARPSPGPSEDLVGFEAALDQLVAGADQLTRHSVDVLAANITLLQTLRARLDGFLAASVATFDAQAGAERLTGARTTTSWLASTTRMNQQDARAVVTVGRRCYGGPGRPAWLPHTGIALLAGRITFEHAREVAVAVRDLPIALHREAEAGLLLAAEVLDPAGLRKVTADVRHQLAPELFASDDVSARSARQFWWATTFHGMVTGGFTLPPEAEAFLAAVLDPLTTTSGDADERTPAQRRADGFLELLASAVGSTGPGQGASPEVIVTVPAETLAGVPGSPAARIGHATDTGRGDGTPISDESVRRLTCDAVVSWLALSGRERYAAMGSARRTAPKRLRRAVEARDGRCRFAGCPVPAHRCQVHHIVHWADSGKTELGNCILLCWHHHDLVHHEGWTVSGDAFGKLSFDRPLFGFRRIPRIGQRPRTPVRE